MEYFVVGFVVAAYFEIFGQYILKRFFNRNETVGFGIGFLVFLSLTYVSTSIFTALGCHFAIIFIIYSCIIGISLFLIIKDIKKIKYRFNIYHSIVLVLIFVFLYYSYNTTLGPLHGLDTTHYLNMVTGNAQWDYLNTKSVTWGTSGNGVGKGYSFQTYYYFASYVVFLCSKILKFIPSTSYIWIFQILFYSTFFSLIVNTYENLRVKRKLVLVLSILLLCFYFCKLYFNSVFGFFGNSYRIVAFGYVSLFLCSYFIENNKENKILITIALLASCSLSSSSVFITIIILFAMFVMFVNKDPELIKWISLSAIMPLINLMSYLTNKLTISIVVNLFICVVLFICSDFVHKCVLKCKLNIVVLVLSVVFMFVMSYRVTGNIFDFDAFFHNASEYKDMTINYFNLNSQNVLRNLYIIIYFASFLIVLIKNRRNYLVLFTLIIFCVFLNPFCCSYFYKVNFVFHRTYDAIINPFTYMYLLNEAVGIISNKKIENAVLLSLIIYSFVNINFLNPTYFVDEFKPSDNYDKIHKMEISKYDIILKLKEDIENNKVVRPRIVTNDLLTQSVITDGIYTFGRYYVINKNWTESEYQIYANFFQEYAYNDLYQPKDVDVNNIQKYIKDAKIDYLVLDKEWSYEDPNTGEWQPLIYKIDEFKFPFYENDQYAIYHFDK